LVDDGRSQEQAWVTDVELAQRLLGPAGNWGDGMQPGSIPLIVLAVLVSLGSDGCAVGCGEQAAGRVEAAGEIVQSCSDTRGRLDSGVVGGQERIRVCAVICPELSGQLIYG
jgi:hypothetical protein